VNDLPADAFTLAEPALLQVVQKDGSIPVEYWGGPIRTLKPLRVYRDRANVAVVTEENDQTERGVYFYVAISSYLPHDGPGRKFAWNEKTKQLEYVFTKPAKREGQ
jgi:hypothetical protein